MGLGVRWNVKGALSWSVLRQRIGASFGILRAKKKRLYKILYNFVMRIESILAKSFTPQLSTIGVTNLM